MFYLILAGALFGAILLVSGILLVRRRRKPAATGAALGAPTRAARPRTPAPPPPGDSEKLEEGRNLLFRLIGELGATIQHLVRAASAYDAGLAQHTTRLQQTVGLDEAKQICAELMADLQAMREANVQYKAELADTQERLSEREQEIASLQLDMNTDYLTRILNRRGLEMRLGEEMERAKRYDTPLSIALFDLDLFKSINDEHGHAAGDKVLRLVAHTLEEMKRTNDAAGRLGGEEFMLLLPAATAEQAEVVAERARRQMERFVTRFSDARIRVTMSGGVTQFKPESDSLDSIMKRVDQALYQAKQNGRNRIELAGE